VKPGESEVPTGKALFERYKEALRRGHVAALEGDHDLAITAYEEAASLAPDRAVPHASLGAVLRSLGRNEDALAAFDRALRRSPSHESALAGRATILAGLGHAEEAAGAFTALGAALEREGRWTEASDAARQALELADSEARRSSLAAISLRLGNLRSDAAAAAALERASAGRRGRPPALPEALSDGPGWDGSTAPAESSALEDRVDPGAPPVPAGGAEFVPTSTPSIGAEPSHAEDRGLRADLADRSALALPDEIDEASRDARLSWVEELSRTLGSAGNDAFPATDQPTEASPDPGVTGSPSPSEEASAHAAVPDALSSPEDASPLDEASPAPASPALPNPILVDPAPAIGPAAGSTPPRPTAATTSLAATFAGRADSADAIALTAEAERRLDRGDVEGAHARFLAAAATHRAGGRVDAALDAYYPVLAGAPADGDLHLALAQLYLERGWRSLAVDKLALLARLADIDGNVALTRQLCGIIAERLSGEPRLAGICPPRESRVAR
jgi:tetratricopeptide (TPR) repeat protein